MNPRPPLHHPIATLLSAPEPGALAVIRLAGPSALEAASRAFHTRRSHSLAHSPLGTPRLGTIGLDPKTRDEAVALPLAPDLVEIYPHGGPLTVQLVLDALAAQGAHILTPESFLHATCSDPTRCAALLDLAHAPTAHAAAILHDQAQGALDAELRLILTLCQAGNAQAAAARLDPLITRAAWGTRLLSGWTIVLGGRPNVGKSCLFNALLGFERAIVTPQPGTTRDAIAVTTAIAGWPVLLVDTAGQRDTPDPIERLGIARAQDQLQHADLALLVLDRSQPLQPDDLALLHNPPGATLIVATKADLPPAWDPSTRHAIVVSSTTGTGLPELTQAIARILFPNDHPPGSPVPWQTTHRHALRQARAALDQGQITATIDALQTLLTPQTLTAP